MREIKKAALIGLGAIGGFAAPGICKALGSENFCVIAGGERRKRLERDGVIINGNNGNSRRPSPHGRESRRILLF